MRTFDETVAQLGYETRRACPPVQTGVGRDRDLSLRTLREAGVSLTGRFLNGEGTTVRLADDLPQTAARADEAIRWLESALDELTRIRGQARS